MGAYVVKKKEKENTFDNIQHKSYFSFSIQSLSHTHSHVKFGSVKLLTSTTIVYYLLEAKVNARWQKINQKLNIRKKGSHIIDSL